MSEGRTAKRGEASVAPRSLRRVPTHELWALRRDGHGAAREELLRRFTPLARKLAARYRGGGEPFEDLTQVAALGLLRAIDRFDADRGAPFAAFAIPTILGELRRHFRDTGWAVRVPRSAQELALRVQETTRTLTDRLGREPTGPELAQAMGVEIDDVRAALHAGQARYGTSLDALVNEHQADSETMGERLGADDDRYAMADARIDLTIGIRGLPHLERMALALRLGQDLRQREIAERLGCSQMQVSRLLSRATARLRAAQGAS